MAAAVAVAGEALDHVRGNVGFLLHADGADETDATAYAMRWGLVNEDRAKKMVQFMTDPTWRAYISSAPSKIDSTRASTKSRLTSYSSA